MTSASEDRIGRGWRVMRSRALLYDGVHRCFLPFRGNTMRRSQVKSAPKEPVVIKSSLFDFRKSRVEDFFVHAACTTSKVKGEDRHSVLYSHSELGKYI
jgi:hypothetical protein